MVCMRGGGGGGVKLPSTDLSGGYRASDVLKMVLSYRSRKKGEEIRSVVVVDGPCTVTSIYHGIAMTNKH